MKSEITAIDRNYLIELKKSVEWNLSMIDDLESYTHKTLGCESESEKEKVMDYLINSFPPSLDEFLNRNQISVKE
jgi:hypothetical protein